MLEPLLLNIFAADLEEWNMMLMIENSEDRVQCKDLQKDIMALNGCSSFDKVFFPQLVFQ